MFEPGDDQARGLRRLFGGAGWSVAGMRLLPVLADRSGARSAGFALNLATALGRTGARAVLLEGAPDGKAIAICGLRARFDLDDLLEGRCRVNDALLRPEGPVRLLMARRGLQRLASQPARAEAVFSAVAALQEGYDVALCHAPAPLLGSILQAMPERDVETALLCGPGDLDLTRTYRRLKTLVQEFGLMRFRVVFVGQIDDAEAGLQQRRLAQAASRFLGASVAFGGCIGMLASAPHTRVDSPASHYPGLSGTARHALERLAASARSWQLPEFPVERLALH